VSLVALFSGFPRQIQRVVGHIISDCRCVSLVSRVHGTGTDSDGAASAAAAASAAEAPGKMDDRERWQIDRPPAPASMRSSDDAE